MKHRDIISKMTLEEKASLLTGKNFWQTANIDSAGIPSITMADGPNGVRLQAKKADHLGFNPSLPATCFPTAAARANSWDTKQEETVGRYLGKEAASQGVHMLLGPGLNIKRSPLCGRNFEYFSEDPYLSGKMAAACIRGIQENGVSACPKHFAANSQELRRMTTDSVMDERTLREVYLTGFEIAVKEGKPKAVMTAYNKVNGVYANENAHLLTDILRQEWGFDGVVVSDWGGGNDHVKALSAGSNLEMPATGKDGIRRICTAVKSGELKEDVLDQRIDEMLDIILDVSRAVETQKGKKFDEGAHHRAAEKAAEDCIVLLKNENQILPIKKGTRVAVIGDFAQKARYQGAGSSMVNPTKLVSIIDIIKDSGWDFAGYEQGFMRNGSEDLAALESAAELAKKAETVILFLGLEEQRESEGKDRTNMKLTSNQLELLSTVAKVNPRIVVVLSAGSALEMGWEKYAMGIVNGFLGGQAGAEAMLRILNGEVCPSGRLSETWPMSYEDTPSYHYYPGLMRTCEYREGIYVGYRYYDTVGIPVKYPFGYGLSYTTFDYSDMKVSKNRVTLTVKNTGRMDGAEVVQIYVGMKNPSVYRPKKELKGFGKVFLRAGESKTIEITLDDKAFRYFDVKTGRWETENGVYEIMAAENVRDIRFCVELEQKGTCPPRRENNGRFFPYDTGDIRKVSDEDFKEILGKEIPKSRWDDVAELDVNDALCQMAYAKSRLARLVFYILNYLMRKNEEKLQPNPNIFFIYNIPFRGIAKMSNGMVTMKMAVAMTELVNAHYFKGLRHLIGGAFENLRSGRY